MVARSDDPIPLRPHPDRTSTVPAQPTPLIGRDTDQQTIGARLRDPQGRLFTLTGPPGVGKTRLALEAVARLDDEFADGVCVVELAPLTDPALVAPRIAATLGLRDFAGRSAADLIQAFLEAKDFLLVLDNFEQVLDAAPLVADLLAACPFLTVLVTSRAPLHLRAEHELPVSPLALPDLAHLTVPDVVAKSAAVVLFVARIRAVRPDFTVTAENAPVLAEICHRLDGLPLALELAAARSKLLPPDALLARLTHRFALLSSGPLDLPARQQTLRSAIDWSYDLLSREEQSLFRRLSVFVGGCTIEAAEAVCADPTAAPLAHPQTQLDQPSLGMTPSSLRGKGVGGLGTPTLDTLASLVDKNLVRQEEHTGEPRLRMLELVREYGLEALTAAGEGERIRERHAGYFTALAETSEPGLKSAEQRSSIATLDIEHDNLRAALGWATERGETEIALRLTGALAWYWQPRGAVSEGRRWIEQALALAAESGPTLARAKALYGAGILAWRQGDWAAMPGRFEESLAVAQACNDPPATAYAVSGLSMVPWLKGNVDAMHPLVEESLTRFEAIDDDWGRAWALCGVGLATWMRGDQEAAQVRFTESLELNRRLGDHWTSAIPLGYLGRLAFRAHENARAQSYWEQSLALYREAGEIGRAAEMLHALAALARLQGDSDQAAAHCREALGLYRDIGFRQGIAACLSELAALLGASGQPERAARVFGAAAALRDAVAAHFPSSDRIDYDAEVATVRDQLDEAVFSAAWSEARSAPVDDVLADALAALSTAPNATDAPAVMTPTAGLSRREVEVLHLLAGGQSNKEIAADLTLSIHTVERHLVNIYAKIGARGRADAVAFALRHNLA